MRHSHTTRRAIACLLLVLGSSACAGGDDADGPSSSPPGSTTTTVADTVPVETTAAPTTLPPTTTTEPPIVGAEWQEFDTPFSTQDAVTAAGQLWISGSVDGVPALASTANAVDWDVYDLAALGLPTGTGGRPVGQTTIGAWNDDLYAVVAVAPQPGLSADGVMADLWVVTSQGAPAGEVRLLAPSETGLDQRLAGAENFRIMDLGSMIEGTDSPTFTAVGQWWVPYQTGDEDFAAIELGDDGRWAITSPDLDDASFDEFVGASLNGVPVAIGVATDSAQVLATWTRTGSGWVAARSPLGTGDAVITGIDSTGSRLVAVGTVDDRPVSWSSSDGISWTISEFPEADQWLGLDVDIVWTGTEFIAITSATTLDGPVWASADGTSWTSVGAHGADRITMWDDRIVAIYGYLWISPPIP